MSQEVTLKNGWLFASDKVSYNNAPYINLSTTKSIQYFQNIDAYNKTTNRTIDKRQSYYISFDTENKLRWHYQYEKDCIHDFKMIQGCIKHETKERLSI